MKNYEQMSDFEINKAVAEAVGFTVGYKVGDKVVNFSTDRLFDPCNNPADAWPVIEENEIGLFPSRSGEWVATKTFHSGDTQTAEFEYTDKNPLCAAMIVFLMMQEKSE